MKTNIGTANHKGELKTIVVLPFFKKIIDRLGAQLSGDTSA
jgi:hypothetical protein